MDKTCEFCMTLSPIVYCKADAAHLCLCCDAKIHSANALSFRHPRTLACESCRYQPMHVRCFDHDMFLCQSCDISSHVLFQHKKKVIGCYAGCPSAKDLAELWGFESNEFEEAVSSNRGAKVFKDGKRPQNSNLILQQIQDLENLQLANGIQSAGSDLTCKLPFKHDKMQKILNDSVEQIDGHVDFQSTGSPSLDGEHFCSPFYQLEQGESSFWQYKSSPVLNNEIWLQNMQDLGVCDEVQCFDNVHIPDVDLTFRNYEELFGNDQNEADVSLNDNQSMSCSFVSEIPKTGKLDRNYGSITTKDITKEQSNIASNETNLSCQAHQLQTTTDSVSSFSVSRITDESSSSEYKDDGLSPTFPRHGLCDSAEINAKLDGRENAIMRYKEKKVLRHGKQSQYASSRSISDVKKRANNQGLKIEEGYGCDSATNVARSI